MLLHGYLWPGNLLWQDGRLVAVVDWEGITEFVIHAAHKRMVTEAMTQLG